MIQLTRCIAERYILCCLYYLSRLLALSESLSTKLFEYVSRASSTLPCGVFPAQESAIVIVGGDDVTNSLASIELGRTLALSLSEAGYTVFALYQAQSSVSEEASKVETSSTPSAKLLYVWHKKKESSGQTAWGLVAPIVLDDQSGAQRTRAAETINAYCENHSLYMAALVIFSPHPKAPTCREATSSRDQSPEITTCKRRSDRDIAEALMWGDIVSQSIKEPILLVQDYVEMLTGASGRVIVISTYPDQYLSGLGLCAPYNGITGLITQYLSQKLKCYGIKVCSASIGPFIRPGTSEPSNSMSHRGPEYWKRQDAHRPVSTLERITKQFMEPFGISQNDVASLIKDIVAARRALETGLHDLPLTP